MSVSGVNGSGCNKTGEISSLSDRINSLCIETEKAAQSGKESETEVCDDLTCGFRSA